MPEYVLLMRLTDQGAKSSAGGLSKVAAKIEKTMEHLQGTMKVVMTLGEYDMVATGHAMGYEELAWLAGHIAAEGKLTVKTVVGFTPDEWDAIQAEAEPQGPTMKPFGH